MFISVNKTDDDLDGEKIQFIYPVDEGRMFFTKRIMRSRKHQLITSKLNELVNLTHVPLLRMKGIGRDLNQDAESPRNKKWDYITESQKFDTSTAVLREIENSFREIAVSITRKDNKRLEVFKSQMVQKFLVDEDIYDTLPDITSLKSKRNSYDIDELYEQLESAGLEVSKGKLEKNFNTLESLNAAATAAFEFAESLNVKKSSTQKKLEAQVGVTESFVRLLLAKALFEQFESIVDDVESMKDERNQFWDLFDDYERVINKFLNNKHFVLGRDGSFKVYSGARDIALKNLSSGEKHIIALLGRAALSREKGSIFIADEPELSLHLTWQRMILPSILELSPKSQIIVATHSPAIISKDSNKIDLGVM